MDHVSDHSSIADQARLVRLCREVRDEHTREECGKTIVAFALTLEHGPTVTVEPDTHRVTVWDRLDEAVHRLDTFIDGPHNPHPILG